MMIDLDDETLALIRAALDSKLTTLNNLGVKGNRTYRADVGAKASAIAQALLTLDAAIASARSRSPNQERTRG